MWTVFYLFLFYSGRKAVWLDKGGAGQAGHAAADNSSRTDS